VTPFVKTGPPSQTHAEITGWHAVRKHLTVPRLLGHHCRGNQHAVIFEDVFADHRCQHLLGDSIALADYGITSTAPVRDLVRAVCNDLLRCTTRTGNRTTLSDCVPALYLERLRPGGRLDTWYEPSAEMALGTTTRTLADLARTEVIVNGQSRRVDVPALIKDARTALSPPRRWMTALTQGDPTEPNIGHPLMWLDFEHAGRNAIAGDVAILLWYLLGMGGWLVPTYQPDTYRRTLRHHLAPIAVPQLIGLTVDQQQIHADLRWNMGIGRAAALHALREALSGDLGIACRDQHPDLAEVLRPFLLCRVLGVIDLRLLDGTDSVLALSMLAQLANPNMTIDKLIDEVTIHAAAGEDAKPRLSRRQVHHLAQLVAPDDSQLPHTEGSR
jgi:hypothetical protein